MKKIDSNCYREKPSLEKTFIGHKDIVSKVCFNPDGNHVISGSLDKTMRLWSLSHPEICVFLDRHTTPILAVDCSIGCYIASGGENGEVYIKKFPSTSLKDTVVFGKHFQPVTTVNFSPDGLHLLTGSHDKTIKLWSVKTHQFLNSFKGHTNWVKEVTFSPVNSLIASCSDDGTVRLWDKYTGTCIKYIKDLKGLSSTKYKVHVRNIRMIQSKPHGLCPQLKILAGTGISFQRNGNAIAVSNTLGSIRVIDIRQMALLQEYKLHNFCTCVCWYPTMNNLSTCGLDGKIFIVDTLNGSCICGIDTKISLNSLSFSKNGERFTCAGNKIILVFTTNMK